MVLSKQTTNTNLVATAHAMLQARANPLSSSAHRHHPKEATTTTTSGTSVVSLANECPTRPGSSSGRDRLSATVPPPSALYSRVPTAGATDLELTSTFRRPPSASSRPAPRHTVSIHSANSLQRPQSASGAHSSLGASSAPISFLMQGCHVQRPTQQHRHSWRRCCQEQLQPTTDCIIKRSSSRHSSLPQPSKRNKKHIAVTPHTSHPRARIDCRPTAATQNPSEE